MGAKRVGFQRTPIRRVCGRASAIISNPLAASSVSSIDVPVMFPPGRARAGGLVGFGARLTLMYRQMARLLVKVLHGTAPAELPVEQPAVFELVFNLKTAAAIGLDIPPSLLLRADKIIE
jgi:putative ABC transport system substrate-binding protein